MRPRGVAIGKPHSQAGHTAQRVGSQPRLAADLHHKGVIITVSPLPGVPQRGSMQAHARVTPEHSSARLEEQWLWQIRISGPRITPFAAAVITSGVGGRAGVGERGLVAAGAWL